jgi:Protein of unknown function (DUF2804)
MRTLVAPPRSVVDPMTRAPHAGSFRGGLPRVVDLAPLDTGEPGLVADALFRFTHRKRWLYGAVAAGEAFIGFAVVQLGYVANCFAFAFDRGAGRMLADWSKIGPAFFAEVGDRPAEGALARFAIPFAGPSVRFGRGIGEKSLHLEIRSPELDVDARFAADGMPPAIGAIVAIEGGSRGLCNATEKGVLMAVTGEARAAGRRIALDGGLGGYDYTQGYLARHTSWRWGFAMGRAQSGERVGLNLVEGFIGEPECAVWIEDEVYPLSEGRFTFDALRPRDPWQVATAGGEVDLKFEPGGMHAEHQNLGVVSSRFVQPVGSFSGTIRLEGRAPLVLEKVLGVAEDQDVLW